MAQAQKTLTLTNPTGLHARPASLFVSTASRFQSTITLEAGEKTANGKSILSVLSLGLGQGATVTIKAEGEDAEAAVAALAELAAAQFHEG